jgi:hypothetical protein
LEGEKKEGKKRGEKKENLARKLRLLTIVPIILMQW